MSGRCDTPRNCREDTRAALLGAPLCGAEAQRTSRCKGEQFSLAHLSRQCRGSQ